MKLRFRLPGCMGRFGGKSSSPSQDSAHLPVSVSKRDMMQLDPCVSCALVKFDRRTQATEPSARSCRSHLNTIVECIHGCSTWPTIRMFVTSWRRRNNSRDHPNTRTKKKLTPTCYPVIILLG